MDTIANMLTKIRNASAVGHYNVKIPYSNFKFKILKVFKEEGFISNVQIIKVKSYSYIKVVLKYVTKVNESTPIPVIHFINLGSKQSAPIYVKSKNIKRELNSLAVTILSTSKGIMSETKAKLNNIGGKVICYIS